MSCDAVEPCEPRPRAVPEVGSGEFVDSRGLYGPYSITAGQVELPNGQVRSLPPMQAAITVHAGELLYSDGEHVWSRGFDYESLGEGHYEDDQL